MSTQNRTTSTSQFDPTSMGVFGGLTSAFGNAINSEINDPYSNMAFNQQLQMQRKSLGQQATSSQEALQQRAQALGINPSSPNYFAQLNKLQRQMMSNQGQGFNQLLLNASQLRQQAIGQAGAYKPLQTGQTQVQTQSGLGSWLPQLAGAALGFAGKAMNPASAIMGGSSPFFGGGMAAQMGMTPQSFQGGDSSFFSGQGFGSNIQPSSYSAPNPFLG